MKIRKIIVFMLALCLVAISGLAGAEEISGSSANTPVWPEIAPSTSYSVNAFTPDPGFHQSELKAYPGPADGLSSTSETWTGFLRQDGRTITVDLGGVRPFTAASLTFWQKTSDGIQIPSHMDISISTDGQSWSLLGRAQNSVSANDPAVQTRTLSMTVQPVLTHYVKISFPVNVWVFARNLSIKGGAVGDTTSQPVILPHDELSDSMANQYLKVPDMKDMMLVYSGAYGQKGTWSKEDFAPLVSYRDTNGNMAGNMFDTMLFLPFPNLASKKDAWSSYLDDLFAPGVQLDALDQTVAEARAPLATGAKEKVILTLPYPDPAETQFGMVDSEGKVLSFSADQQGGADAAFQSRLAATKWYYQQLMDRWNKAQYQNLELAGIYWYSESINPQVPKETELIRSAAKMVHDANQKFFWIPFFGSQGYANWENYKFDYVLLQPNFYFTNESPIERMDNVAQLAKKYNLGVELECDEKVLSDAASNKLFYQQLDRAHQLGLDQDTTNAFYVGTKTLVEAANSTDPMARKVYDDVHKWISGTYGK
jgi:hypothetical protein